MDQGERTNELDGGEQTESRLCGRKEPALMGM